MRELLYVIVITLSVGPLPADRPGGFYTCPDHTIVSSSDQCPNLGNKFEPIDTTPPPGQFPGGGGGGSGGLLGLVHKLTGGLL